MLVFTSSLGLLRKYAYLRQKLSSRLRKDSSHKKFIKARYLVMLSRLYIFETFGSLSQFQSHFFKNVLRNYIIFCCFIVAQALLIL